MLLAELNCLQLNCAMKTNTELNAAAVHLLVVPPTFTSASNTGGSAKNVLSFPTHLPRFLSQIPIRCPPHGPAEHSHFIWL